MKEEAPAGAKEPEQKDRKALQDCEDGMTSTATGRSSRSEGTLSFLDMAKLMANPRNLRNFIVDIVLCEIIGKQIPLALAMALPAMVVDMLIGFVAKPQNEFVYEDEAHMLAHNATFNVHMDYNPRPREPGVLGSYVAGHVSFLVCLYGWFTWNLIYIPRCVLTKEQYDAATPKRFLASLSLQMALTLVLLFVGGMQAGKVDGGHHYAIVGSFSPAIVVILIYAANTAWRGVLINRVTGTNLWLVGLCLCSLANIVVTMEVIYVGLSGMPLKRKELIIFVYRAFVWPLIWYVVVVPLFRYVLLMTSGEATNVIPYLGYLLTFISVSSRTVMYAVDNELFFLILAAEDALLQAAFNYYSHRQPLADQVILEKLWRRCLRLSDTGEVVRRDDSRASMMRMFWFQSQSVVELTVVFTQTVRTWAFYESRHIFANMFRPNCDSLDGFDWEQTLTKLAISVAMISIGDLASSYFIYCKDFPLAEAFQILLKSPR